MIKYQINFNQGTEALNAGKSITANEIVETVDEKALAREIHHLNALIPEQVAESVLANFCAAAAELMAMGYAVVLKNGNDAALRIYPDIKIKGGNINLDRAKELDPSVSELTMASVCIGMTLHGGLITAMGTFFVFSDYMKPAIRMAALMQLPVKFVWTHDAFRVGEDGPTHEPVEQEAQIRLMEKLKNHSGRDSVRVFRPCDVHAATKCWQLAMENMDTPTALIFSRQNVKDLPQTTDYSGVARGAYEVVAERNPDVILVASGSEVSTLAEAAQLLAQDGIKARVVSCPSEGLFRRQSKEYQESILPKGAKIFGLTAGLPVTFEGLVGGNGRVYGLDHFGYSAPYKVLDEKLGYTPQNMYHEIKKFLSE